MNSTTILTALQAIKPARAKGQDAKNHPPLQHVKVTLSLTSASFNTANPDITASASVSYQKESGIPTCGNFIADFQALENALKSADKNSYCKFSIRNNIPYIRIDVSRQLQEIAIGTDYDIKDFTSRSPARSELTCLQSRTALPAQITATDAANLAIARKHISPDEVRYVLNGVLLDAGSTPPRIVATDGRRLISAPITSTSLNNIIADDKTQFIIPSDAFKPTGAFVTEGFLNTFKSAQTKDQTPTHISHTYQHPKDPSIQMGVMAKLIDGNYPNYTAVIPKPDDIKMSAHLYSAPAIKAIQAIAKQQVVKTSQPSEPPAVELTFTESHITLSSQLFKLSIKVPARHLLPFKAPLKILINPQYLLDAINPAIPTLTIHAQANGNHPIVITYPHTYNLDSSTSITIMPMKSASPKPTATTPVAA